MSPFKDSPPVNEVFFIAPFCEWREWQEQPSGTVGVGTEEPLETQCFRYVTPLNEQAFLTLSGTREGVGIHRVTISPLCTESQARLHVCCDESHRDLLALSEWGSEPFGRYLMHFSLLAHRGSGLTLRFNQSRQATLRRKSYSIEKRQKQKWIQHNITNLPFVRKVSVCCKLQCGSTLHVFFRRRLGGFDWIGVWVSREAVSELPLWISGPPKWTQNAN